MNTFTFSHLPFTMLLPLAFHIGTRKTVKGEMINEVTGGSV